MAGPVKVLLMARRMIDPKTREACAFYAATAAACWDVVTRGFHLWNVVFLAALCGVSVAGLVSLLLGRNQEPVTVEAEKEGE